ncbi:MAG: methyltransferase [Bacilli bacterium]|nr:methyltransferase [Bacilli bacterium]
MGQYFENDETLAHQDITWEFTFLGEKYSFKSDLGVFSKEGLDDGTRLLLEAIAKAPLGERILDLGCGVGPIGLVLAHLDDSRKVTLCDVNLRALEKCRQNATNLGVSRQVEIVPSDVYSNINSRFDTIVTNPPIRAGKKVTYAMYAGAPDHLNEDGRLILVIRKQQGAESCFKYLQTLFENVVEVTRKKGYRVLIATKARRVS